VDLAVDESVNNVGTLLLTPDAAGLGRDVVVVGLAGDVVRAGDATGMLGMTVGILTLSLDRNDATMPPTLDKMLFICRRS
jgi:hypothetical protein